jgi:hypothetical protein
MKHKPREETMSKSKNKGPTWLQVAVAQKANDNQNHSNKLPPKMRKLVLKTIEDALTTPGWSPKK